MESPHFKIIDYFVCSMNIHYVFFLLKCLIFFNENLVIFKNHTPELAIKAHDCDRPCKLFNSPMIRLSVSFLTSYNFI